VDEVAVRAGWGPHNWRKARTVLRGLAAEGLAQTYGLEQDEHTPWRLKGDAPEPPSVLPIPGPCRVAGVLTTQPIGVGELAGIVGVPLPVVRSTIERLISDGLAVDLGRDIVCRTDQFRGKR
jgi:hypothetical protein